MVYPACSITEGKAFWHWCRRINAPKSRQLPIDDDLASQRGFGRGIDAANPNRIGNRTISRYRQLVPQVRPAVNLHTGPSRQGSGYRQTRLVRITVRISRVGCIGIGYYMDLIISLSLSPGQAPSEGRLLQSQKVGSECRSGGNRHNRQSQPVKTY